MSDQYVKLEEERRQKERAEKKKKEKKKRKERRTRGKKHDSGPESEEDITPAHMVDIVTEEMPEVRKHGSDREGMVMETESEQTRDKISFIKPFEQLK